MQTMVANPKDVARHYFSLEEYFALEHVEDARYEYWNGDIFCMSGGTRAHGTLSMNAVVALANAVRGTNCQAFTADTAILTPTLPPYRYPDASVGCGELEFKRVQGLDALVNPVVIVEVLSPSTALRDCETKFEAYQAIPSFREYVLIAQNEVRVIHYTRQADDSWQRRDVTELDGSLVLESINCTLSVRELYERVTFADSN
jgi:Uma2 family endonuclease